MRVDEPLRITPADPGWPVRLARLGSGAPEVLELFGNADLLAPPALAIFCSIRPPGRVIVESFELAATFAAEGGVVVGGFHSPLEREILRELLGGSASVILCPARSLRNMSLPGQWASAMAEGRMLLVSPFAETLRRPTASVAERRNRLAAALSSRVMILHATSGGRTARLARECCVWGLPLHCLDHPANEDLRLLGALPVSAATRPRSPANSPQGRA